MEMRGIASGPLTWAVLRDLVVRESLSLEAKVAAGFALDELERDLGERWPARVAETVGIPGEISLAGMNVFALARMLELGLRLHLLRSYAGMAEPRGKLKSTPTPQELAHLTLQLELSSLALRLGLVVELEPFAARDRKRADVLIRAPEGELLVEAVALLRDDRSVAGDRRASQLHNSIRNLRGAHGVSIAGKITCELDDELVAELLEEIERVASFVGRGGHCPSISRPGVDLSIRRGIPVAGESLGITIHGEDHARRYIQRLRSKATHTAATGARWIRIDLLDMLFQKMELLGWSFDRRVEWIATNAAVALGDIDHLDGVVVSDGATVINVGAQDETLEAPGGVRAIRRRLDRLRVRETIVVPLREDVGAVSGWCSLYESEPSWLSWALKKVGLIYPPELMRKEQQAIP